MKLRAHSIADLGQKDTVARRAVFDVIQKIAGAARQEYGISQDTFLFGGRGKLPRNKIILLLALVKSFHEVAEKKGDNDALSAVAYCQSMAILLLAGSEASRDEEEMEFVLLKHEFGEQTSAMFLGSRDGGDRSVPGANSPASAGVTRHSVSQHRHRQKAVNPKVDAHSGEGVPRAAGTVLRVTILACGALWFLGAATHIATVQADEPRSADLPKYNKLRNSIDRASKAFLEQLLSDPIQGIGLAVNALPGSKGERIVYSGYEIEANIGAAFPGDDYREDEVHSRIAQGGGRWAAFVLACFLIVSAARWDGRLTKGPFVVGTALFVLALALSMRRADSNPVTPGQIAMNEPPVTAGATFSPEGCEFSVIFPDQPTVRSLEAIGGITFLQAEGRSGGSYLRAECIPWVVEGGQALEALKAQARADGLSDWSLGMVESTVAELRGYKVVTGRAATYVLRWHLGNKSALGLMVAAPSESYPTPTIQQFIESVSTDPAS